VTDEQAADDDWALLKRTTAEDASGYEQLVEKHYSAAVAFCAQVVGDHHRAEDVVQRAFVNIFQARERIEDRAKFTTFLYKVLLNLSINELARKKGPVPLSSVVSADDAPAESLFQDLASPDPTRQIETEECLEMIRRGVMQLSPKHRAALYLREYTQLSYNEIAAALDASLNEVKIWIFRGRNKLEEILKPYLEEGKRIR
jgi:RNA polymerase sigma-70 factor, ECF subfamily